jgi:hypothetical protein
MEIDSAALREIIKGNAMEIPAAAGRSACLPQAGEI